MGEYRQSGAKCFDEAAANKYELRSGEAGVYLWGLRIDFYMERNGEKFLTEVKGCTLADDLHPGTGLFPDAPTERGVKTFCTNWRRRQRKGTIVQSLL